MLVDDAALFAPQPSDVRQRAPLMHSAAAANAVHAHSIKLLDELAMSENDAADERMRQAPTVEDTLGLLDRDGHRRRAGYLSAAAGSAAYWALQPMPGPIGPRAASGELLSPPCRERMLLSLEKDAPAAVLQELRALARSSSHTGVSAWRAVRERERGRGAAH